jgi:cation diffusion facilitator family transporter
MESTAITTPEQRQSLLWSINLSLGVGMLMLLLKFTAYWFTGSSAILSDAAESIVHVVAVAFAAYSLRLSFKPADASHPYGHSKISFFSAGVEGALIAVAALFIIYSSVRSWMSGLVLENLGLGTALTAVAVAVNGALGAYLIQAGRRRNSLILVANGKHVLTDCWTSLGVVIAVVLTMFTGWLPWDPIFGILMALNILWSGYGLVRESVAGLLDEADPAVRAEIERILTDETERRGIRYHEVRHRHSGAGHLVDVHLLFPESTPIGEAHRAATEIETILAQSIQPHAEVQTHLEPMESHDSAHSADREAKIAQLE